MYRKSQALGGQPAAQRPFRDAAVLPETGQRHPAIQALTQPCDLHLRGAPPLATSPPIARTGCAIGGEVPVHRGPGGRRNRRPARRPAKPSGLTGPAARHSVNAAQIRDAAWALKVAAPPLTPALVERGQRGGVLSADRNARARRRWRTVVAARTSRAKLPGRPS